MKQMAASAATRNVSRSFKSMAGGRLAAELYGWQKLPLQDSLLWLRIVRQISPGRKRGESGRTRSGISPGRSRESCRFGKPADRAMLRGVRPLRLGSSEVIHALPRCYPCSGSCACSVRGGGDRRDGGACPDQNGGVFVRTGGFQRRGRLRSP